MVYQKPDGSFGFNWQQQYDFLLREHPDELENIVQSKFSLLKTQHPEQAEYYEELKTELNERIGNASDSPNFGYKESNDIVLAFVKEKGLQKLFSDVSAFIGNEINKKKTDMIIVSSWDFLGFFNNTDEMDNKFLEIKRVCKYLECSDPIQETDVHSNGVKYTVLADASILPLIEPVWYTDCDDLELATESENDIDLNLEDDELADYLTEI